MLSSLGFRVIRSYINSIMMHGMQPEIEGSQWPAFGMGRHVHFRAKVAFSGVRFMQSKVKGLPDRSCSPLIEPFAKGPDRSQGCKKVRRSKLAAPITGPRHGSVLHVR